VQNFTIVLYVLWSRFEHTSFYRHTGLACLLTFETPQLGLDNLAFSKVLSIGLDSFDLGLDGGLDNTASASNVFICGSHRTRMVWLPNGEKSLRTCLAISIEYQHVPDRWTSCDGRISNHALTITISYDQLHDLYRLPHN